MSPEERIALRDKVYRQTIGLVMASDAVALIREQERLLALASKALESGLLCARLAIGCGGAVATEVNEEELPLILRALREIEGERTEP